MTQMTRRLFAISCAAALLLPGVGLGAQSRSFKYGQWMEIQNAVMRELNRNYVDTLPLDRMYKDGLKAMLSDLDPYTVYVPEEEQEDFTMMISKTYGGIGAVIYKPDKQGYVVINEPYEGSPAALAGLRCGDEIMEVDGVSTIGLNASQSSSRMKGEPGTKVLFKVKKLHADQPVDIEITRQKIHLPDVQYAGMLDAETGYILLSSFTDRADEQVLDAFCMLKDRGMKRLVLDLRGNGGGLLSEAVDIVSIFVPKNTLVVSSKGVDQNIEYRTDKEPLDTQIPILVMVDSGSASASEIVSGALQDLDRATVAGKRTFGKGLVQSIRSLPYNGQLKVTTAKYYTPSGRCVQAIDYSHRNEDGSVGHIPDSLTHEFRTASGRIVRDGGGITPDIKVDAREYSRITYAVVMSALADNYSIEFVRSHESIPPVEQFCLSDEDYAKFVQWAAGEKFDCRTESQTYYDLLVEQMGKDGLDDKCAEALEKLKEVVYMDKKTALETFKDEIVPFLEEEIAIRYYFQEAGVQVRLKTDSQLKEALQKWVATVNKD